MPGRGKGRKHSEYLTHFVFSFLFLKKKCCFIFAVICDIIKTGVEMQELYPSRDKLRKTTIKTVKVCKKFTTEKKGTVIMTKEGRMGSYWN